MKTVVVTGARGGIGAAVIELFNASGWRTIGVDRAAPGEDHSARYLQSDIADADGLTALSDALREEDRIDALVNNAAVMMDKDFADLSVADWDATMNTNVRPAFVLTQALLPQLAAAIGGVVNVASVHAIATSRGVAAYAASKGALVAFTRATSLDLASFGVRVNAVCPGATDTPMLRGDPAMKQALVARTPLGRIAEPSEIAQAVLFLADSERSGFITGQTLVVDGGATSKLSTE
ncbi:MAG TPA: SDR family NAD(P)-dependent oxidoreductase [Acidimicrobiales bacterium]|nr:SDR family NAD(P)-dependent oxidoreductase [Acidimicrobiales bacterium]